MFGPGLDLPPLMAAQQPIHGRSGHGAAHAGFVASFNGVGGDQLPGFGLRVQRREEGLRLGQRQMLMAASTFGPALGRRQAALQIIRPDPPDMAHAQAHHPGDGFGGQIFLGAQPKALQPLKGGGGWRPASRDESRRPAQREFQCAGA